MEKISVQIALSNLEQLSAETRAAYEKYLAVKDARDASIRDARAGGVPYPMLMSKTRLSRDRLIKIAQTPDTPSS